MVYVAVIDGAQGVEKNIGPKWEEVAGGCRRLHKEEHHTLYYIILYY
jgi:hypothetical protein